MTIDQVREELKDVKIFYARKDFIDNFVDNNVIARIKENVQKYDTLILCAPEKLFNLYVALYREGCSQFSYSIQTGYHERYIQRLNKELLEYFLNQIKRQA